MESGEGRQLDSGLPAKGICAKCGEKCAEIWTANPCKHEACSKCLESSADAASCFGCHDAVAFFTCPGSQHGCTFDTTQGSCKDHLFKCLSLPLECPNRCGMPVVRKLLLSHLVADCQLRLATCQFCKETVFELELTDHENSCPKAPVICPYCLQEGLKREEMPHHAEGCSETPKPCPLQEYGCNFSGVDKDIDDHLTVKNHVVCFRELKKNQREHHLEIGKLQSELSSCKSVLDLYKSELDSCKNELAELSNGCGATLFDKEALWIFQAPLNGHGYLFSPLYRHRGTGTVLYLKLHLNPASSSGFSYTLSNGSTVYITLYQYQIQAGRSRSSSTFAAIIHSLAQGTGTKWEVAKKVGIRQNDEKILEGSIVTGTQYIVSYKQEN